MCNAGTRQWRRKTRHNRQAVRERNVNGSACRGRHIKSRKYGRGKRRGLEHGHLVAAPNNEGKNCMGLCLVICDSMGATGPRDSLVCPGA
jgi:hypothetical protein